MLLLLLLRLLGDVKKIGTLPLLLLLPLLRLRRIEQDFALLRPTCSRIDIQRTQTSLFLGTAGTCSKVARDLGDSVAMTGMLTALDLAFYPF